MQYHSQVWIVSLFSSPTHNTHTFWGLSGCSLAWVRVWIQKVKQWAFGSELMLHPVFVSFISSVFFSWIFTDCPFSCFFFWIFEYSIFLFLSFSRFINFSFSFVFALSRALRAFGVFTPNLAFQHSWNIFSWLWTGWGSVLANGYIHGVLNKKKMDIGSKGVNEGYNNSGWLERLRVNYKQRALVCVSCSDSPRESTQI